ncbi:uncharacterized protein LOC134239796 [Saccostrea cucullata]|uniref:uncharacterized protein LOC134239796 n=1 Tax=Saccostrea cuccullata TaxID=36930 RepID=UPI002ED0D134
MDYFLNYLICMLIVMNSASTGLNQEVCDSNTGPVCCDGYYREQITGNCIRCRPGYFDLNCSKKCGYPTYGEQCQKICRCTRTQCNFSHGCIVNFKVSDESSLNLFSPRLQSRKSNLLFVNRNEMNTVINAHGNYQIKYGSTTSSVLVTGNESRTLKSDSYKSNSEHPKNIRSNTNDSIIAITFSVILVLGGIIAVTVQMIRICVCKRKEKSHQKGSPLIMSDLITS